MHRIRAIRLVLCVDVWGRLGEKTVRVLERAVAAEKAEGGSARWCIAIRGGTVSLSCGNRLGLLACTAGSRCRNLKSNCSWREPDLPARYSVDPTTRWISTGVLPLPNTCGSRFTRPLLSRSGIPNRSAIQQSASQTGVPPSPKVTMDPARWSRD